MVRFATFNIQNPNIDSFSFDDKYNKFIDIVKKNKIDVLCLQESILEFDERIKDFGYKVIGGYRYKGILSKIFILNKFNESNPIVTKLPVILESTYKLPWIPNNLKDLKNSIFKYKSITPRLLTEGIVKIGDNYIKVFNTHIERKILNIKRRQFNLIFNKIKNSNYPSILMGDFNSGSNNKEYKRFLKNMESIGYISVDLPFKTYKYSKDNRAIDHIFIHNSLKFDNLTRIDNDISDHYMIYIDVSLIKK